MKHLHKENTSGFNNIIIQTIVVEEFIQPFKELPCENYSDNQNEQINAHELFSFYTVNVMRENIVYAR